MGATHQVSASRGGFRRFIASIGARGRQAATEPLVPARRGTDTLTGVGDRKSVDERARSYTRSGRFQHHLVFIVELDRVPMVNDVFGRHAGDVVLSTVAQRLQSTADRLAASDDMESTVARIRGDEFLLSVHAEHSLNVMLVCDRLERIRSDSVEVDARQLPLDFSMGFVYAEGTHDLGELMAVADLKLLADRTARTAARQRASDQLAPPGTVVDPGFQVRPTSSPLVY